MSGSSQGGRGVGSGVVVGPDGIIQGASGGGISYGLGGASSPDGNVRGVGGGGGSYIHPVSQLGGVYKPVEGVQIAMSSGGAASGFSNPVSMPAPPKWLTDLAGEMEKDAFQISVYLDDGMVFEYVVHSSKAALDHSAAIAEGGYRSISKETPNVLIHYPAHRITKVEVVGTSVLHTQYHDRVRGT